MTVLATIGATGLYLLFVWLASAAVASWLSDRKGYGERLGLAFGLLLSAAGLLIVLLLPGRPGSRWREEGPVPWRVPRDHARPPRDDARPPRDDARPPRDDARPPRDR